MKKITLITLLLLSACRHKPEEAAPVILQLAPQQALLYESDSIQLTLMENNIPVTANVDWTTTAGTIASSGLFISEAIQTDTQRVVITAQYNGRQATAVIAVTKRAFLDSGVSFSQAVLPVFVSNCNFSGCHGNGSRASRVELSCYDSVMQAVLPFNAAGSRVYFSLIKTDPLRVMPPAGKLHQHKIDIVRNWIEQGARNN